MKSISKTWDVPQLSQGMLSSQYGGHRIQVYCSIGKKGHAQLVKFLVITDKRLFRKTVARRLYQGGLYAQRSVVCVALLRVRCSAHLKSCRQHRNWTENDLISLLFLDPFRGYFLDDKSRQICCRLQSDDILNLI